MIDIKVQKRLNGYSAVSYICGKCGSIHLVTMRHGKILHMPILIENCQDCANYIGDVLGLIVKDSHAKKEYHVAGLHIGGSTC
jgi:hypothetical protein